VEGALQTAEIVLQKHFGLSKPTWLTVKSSDQLPATSDQLPGD
jgi:hypothetical protein